MYNKECLLRKNFGKRIIKNVKSGSFNRQVFFPKKNQAKFLMKIHEVIQIRLRNYFLTLQLDAAGLQKTARTYYMAEKS